MMKRQQQKIKRLRVIFCCFLGTIVTTSQAEEGHHHHAEQALHHQAEAHVHGVANLNWVFDDAVLHIAIESPMMDLLGFEHKPHNEEQKKLFNIMLTSLKDTEKVVDVIGGQCELTDVSIINPFEQDEHHQHHNSAVSEQANHNEVTAEYAFLCQQPSQLEAININLFDTFSGFKVINAQWIVDGKQGGARLTHDHHLVKVR